MQIVQRWICPAPSPDQSFLNFIGCIIVENVGKQESIPVGCLPPTFLVRGVCPTTPWMQIPGMHTPQCIPPLGRPLLDADSPCRRIPFRLTPPVGRHPTHSTPGFVPCVYVIHSFAFTTGQAFGDKCNNARIAGCMQSQFQLIE